MAMFAAVAGAVLQGAGKLSSGLAQAGQQEAAANAAQYNADVSRNQAATAYTLGVQREQAVRDRAAQQLGAQRAAVAESGFNPNAGSALDTQLQSVRNAELDALQTRYQGILQGSQYEQQAAIDQYQADAARKAARGAKIGAYLSLAGQALSSYSSYGGSMGGASGASTSSFGGLSSMGSMSSMTGGSSWGVGSNTYGFSMR
ncbi:hypothetical protein [Burkholderia multivorans]|uniref:Uncharacterized protein n=2 Tax=root TaxID=1 RepID=A0A2S1GN52_9CAUD|nr:hypothetical protein [Burkholderia multivorans]YP_009800742.1 hypothetical protein HOT12_gp53 [Burkholderia phage vB_BmuP_KL4]AWD90807.1 hypothetical protein [Burkholderia phage vB_BmuP_KL4]MBR8244786.1 hypothetical protein [Burkholderia multivorans]PRG35693.1 hypothetical protein C6T52_17180 [Burkholderia multivorans]QGR60428.1 hypothetical protein FOC27_09435 [Burkholderia multivorans]HDR9337717.1 hypothetical protein [Burkholderia multivorans]